MAGLGDELDQAAGEVMRRGRRDLGGDVGAGSQRAVESEVDELVLAGAATGDGRILAAGPLDQELFDATDAGAVLGQCAALDDDPQPLEALAARRRVDEEIGAGGGRRSPGGASR